MSIHKRKFKENDTKKENEEKINFSLFQNYNHNNHNNNYEITRDVLVINNALPNELYDNLEKEYISLKTYFF